MVHLHWDRILFLIFRSKRVENLPYLVHDTQGIVMNKGLGGGPHVLYFRKYNNRPCMFHAKKKERFYIGSYEIR